MGGATSVYDNAELGLLEMLEQQQQQFQNSQSHQEIWKSIVERRRQVGGGHDVETAEEMMQILEEALRYSRNIQETVGPSVSVLSSGYEDSPSDPGAAGDDELFKTINSWNREISSPHLDFALRSVAYFVPSLDEVRGLELATAMTKVSTLREKFTIRIENLPFGEPSDLFSFGFSMAQPWVTALRTSPFGKCQQSCGIILSQRVGLLVCDIYDRGMFMDECRPLRARDRLQLTIDLESGTVALFVNDGLLWTFTDFDLEEFYVAGATLMQGQELTILTGQDDDASLDEERRSGREPHDFFASSFLPSERRAMEQGDSGRDHIHRTAYLDDDDANAGTNMTREQSLQLLSTDRDLTALPYLTRMSVVSPNASDIRSRPRLNASVDFGDMMFRDPPPQPQLTQVAARFHERQRMVNETTMTLSQEAEVLRVQMGLAKPSNQKQSAPKAASDKKVSEEPGGSSSNCCCVCMENEKCVVVLPCRHLCLCQSCSELSTPAMTTCPLCREPVVSFFRVFT